MENFAKKLKELRMERGISQRQVSKELGLSENAFANYEQGIREPSLDTLKKICEFFNVSADYLIGISDSY